MAKIEEVEDLKNHFSSKAGLGEKLPNPKDVADKSEFYRKSGDTYENLIMINGKWHRKVVNDVSRVVFEPVE